jgi:hypothetical protein
MCTDAEQLLAYLYPLPSQVSNVVNHMYEVYSHMYEGGWRMYEGGSQMHEAREDCWSYERVDKVSSCSGQPK